MSRSWQALVDAVGGVSALCEALGVTKMTYWRMTTGKTNPRPVLRKKVAKLAELHKVQDPLPPIQARQKPDLRALELFGQGLSMKLAPKNTADHLKFMWPEDKLIALAETSDNEHILRAVTYLLEA